MSREGNKEEVRFLRQYVCISRYYGIRIVRSGEYISCDYVDHNGALEYLEGEVSIVRYSDGAVWFSIEVESSHNYKKTVGVSPRSIRKFY